MSLNTCNKFIHAEWLGDIVVSARAEPLYPVGILDPCREEDYRTVYMLSYTLTYLIAVHAGHVDIKKDEIRTDIHER